MLAGNFGPRLDQDQKYWQKTGRQYKSIHWPPVFGHGWTKIRNTGKRPAGQHRSKYWPTNLGPLLDQDQKYWPKIAGMNWYWTNIDPILCADWVATIWINVLYNALMVYWHTLCLRECNISALFWGFMLYIFCIQTKFADLTWVQV